MIDITPAFIEEWSKKYDEDRKWGSMRRSLKEKSLKLSSKISSVTGLLDMKRCVKLWNGRHLEPRDI